MDRRAVVDQARSIAAARSPPGAPPSWWLTAGTFTAIAEDDELLDLAAAIPLDRLPPLSLSAAVQYRLDDCEDERPAACHPDRAASSPA